MQSELTLVNSTPRRHRCTVSGCTIVRCQSNDGVTLHSGERDAHGVRQGITGDENMVENNVIGLCREESIDITPGDRHTIRRNICYGNGNPGIIVGHDSGRNLIENNISFGNARAGIHISGNAAEGSTGGNRVVRNLVYDNGYPGLEIGTLNALRVRSAGSAGKRKASRGQPAKGVTFPARADRSRRWLRGWRHWRSRPPRHGRWRWRARY